MRQHHKVLMKMMKDELKRWEREMNYRGSESEEESDEESIEIKEDIELKPLPQEISLKEEEDSSKDTIKQELTCISCHNELKPLKDEKKELNSLSFYENTDSSSIPFGLYAFYMLENHIYNLKNQNKIIKCPYKQCNESFYVHFEMMDHIKRSHIKNISMTYYCDYPGCTMKFEGTNGRIQRRHHIETEHLNIEHKQCDECDHTLFTYLQSTQQGKKEIKRKGRGRGRPKKKKTITKPVLEQQPVKKRGRPSTKLYKENENMGHQPKRKPGRPKKS